VSALRAGEIKLGARRPPDGRSQKPGLAEPPGDPRRL